MQITDSLMQVGLSRHEAQLYELLHREGAMTGYEAAKVSGISRSNIYPALYGLVEKGAARKIDGDVQRFIAVPVQSFCRSKQRQYDQILHWIEKNMPALQSSSDPFVTINGETNILNQMKDLIENAKLRVYLGLDSTLMGDVLREIDEACSRGLKVVLITDKPVTRSGVTVYLAKRQLGQIRLIVDSEQVMTGELRSDGPPTCLYSKNKALVTLFKEAMMNEIKLIERSILNE